MTPIERESLGLSKEKGGDFSTRLILIYILETNQTVTGVLGRKGANWFTSQINKPEKGNIKQLYPNGEDAMKQNIIATGF